mmetsp:Transcript_1846/g.5070  ORF Transcript_1846/g.5070 Transcript_1846/m.5070 type:complete len:175 (-) Transcript_1846:180-704(-)
MGPEQVRKLLAQIAALLRSEEFGQVSSAYLEEHCLEFEDQEENRLEWTELHRAYVHLCEAHVTACLGGESRVKELAEALPGLLAQEGGLQLDDASAESLDFILSLDNFEDFKDSMLARKAVRTIEALEILEVEAAEELSRREAEIAELGELRKKLDMAAAAPSLTCKAVAVEDP